MEQEQFISDDLDHSSNSNQGFETDRFTKTRNNFSIPDTILENRSAELSGNSLKMDPVKITKGACNSDDKENICSNKQVISNAPLNSSAHAAIDKSYIKQCEKNLLEGSYNDCEKNSELDNKCLVNRLFLDMQSKHKNKSKPKEKQTPQTEVLDVCPLFIISKPDRYNDTISTPPSLLRKEISALRNEMTEAHEFHDRELILLQEERSGGVVESTKYVELFDKYSSLVELYTNLKNELDDCKKNQECMRNEIQSKTADYLESLCSQIETSDNSLNMSTSFFSLSGGVKSSTMLEGASEIETTMVVVNERTILAKDPLSITIDNDKGAFKTPTQTPLRSAKKPFPKKVSSSVGKQTGKAKDMTPKQNLTLDSEYNIQLLNLETALYDKVKEVESLEERLFKVEDMSLVLHSEFERIGSIYMKDNTKLKEELSTKTEQLNELTQKLVTETISLNPSLKDSLNDVPGTKLMAVFIETIMENCKKIKDDDQLTTIENLRDQLSSQESKLMELKELRTTCEDWKAKFLDASNTIATREEEIKMLQSHALNVRQTKQDLESAQEAVAELQSKLRTIEAEKTAAESRCRDLEESLTRKVSEGQSQLVVAHEKNSQIENDNTHLKELYETLQAKVQNMVSEHAEEIRSLKSSHETELQELRQISQDLKARILEAETTISTREEQIKTLQSDIERSQKETTESKAALLQLETEKRCVELEGANELSRVNSVKLEVEQRCRELEDTLAKLQSEGSTKMVIIKEFEETKEKLEREREVLRQESKEALDELVTKLKAIEAEKAAAENRCGDLEDVVENLKRETDANQNMEKELQMQLSFALEKKCDTENENTRLKEMQETLQGKIQNMVSEHAEEIRSLRSSHETELEDLRQISEDLKARILEAETTIFAREEQIKTLRSDIERSQKETTESKAALLQLETEKRCIELEGARQLARVNAVKLEVEQRCRELEETMAKLQSEGSTNSVIIKEFKETKEKLEREREISRQESKEALDELVTKLKAIEAEKAAAENRCGDLEDVVENLKREVEVKQNLEKELQTELSSALVIKTNAEKERVHFKELYETLQAKTENLISEHVEEIRSLKLTHETELRDLKQTSEDLKARILEAETTISAQEIKIKTLQSDIERSQKETTEAKAAVSQLETEKRGLELEGANQLSRANSEKLEIEKRCRELEESLAKIQAESNRKMAIIKQLEESLEKLERERQTLLLQNRCVDETVLRLKSQLTIVEHQKSEMEIRCSDLQESNHNLQVEITWARNLENNPQYERIQNENDDLKQRVLDYEKMVTDLKCELEDAKINQRNNISEVEELLREVEDLKKENSGFSQAFVALEETQKSLADMLSDLGNDSDLPGDRVTKVIAKSSKSQNTRENKIVFDFVETVSKTCKGVQNELIKKFDNEKQEWKTQRDVDLQNLRGQIEVLAEKNVKQEAVLKRAKDDLATADDAIQKLQSELSTAQMEKNQAKHRCQELEEGALNLKAVIGTKETIIKSLEELKSVSGKLETENGNLKRQILESEEMVNRLKRCLQEAQEEQNFGELKLRDIESEILMLKKEKESLIDASERLKDLEKSHKSLIDVLSDVQSNLELPEDTLTKFLSEESKNRKIFIERINFAIENQMENLKVENRTLKMGHDSLKERVKQLTRIIEETAEGEPKDLSNVSSSYTNGVNMKNKMGKRMDRYVRRLDKLEEINHNLTELLIRILTTTGFPDIEQLNLSSLRDFPKTMKKVLAHLDDFVSKMKELDEECETYSNVIKDLKKEAVTVWKSNTEKTEAMEAEIACLKEEKNSLENQKQDLLAKISRLESECHKLQNTEGQQTCVCGNDPKKVNELKRAVLLKEQKLLEMQDLEGQTSALKSQIDYLKNALERERKKAGEEKEKNKRLQIQINEANERSVKKRSEEHQVLEELRMRGSISGGIVQEFGDKEKMRKLVKDIGLLKELCRARYSEIKRLEAVNASLRSAAAKQAATPKNSNQMDSPIHSGGYNTRSKHRVRDVWQSEIVGKENGGV